ncbi:MAG: hypothetical protein ACR2OC_12145 [Solirubrobacterales bacterium]
MSSTPLDLQALPGAEIILEGLADLDSGRETECSDAVLMASARLRAAGLDITSPPMETVAAHRLYDRLAEADPRNAHSRYNAIVRRVVSFARAVENARSR